MTVVVWTAKKRNILKIGTFLGEIVLKMARAKGLEPSASNVTGWRSNQLSYAPTIEFMF